jgi:uncharacterized lipoprotein YmbA
MAMRFRFIFATIVVASVALTGCGSDKPTRLYVLNATAEHPAAMSSQGVAIGVGPITLPKYLDRPQIVMGVSANQLSQANLDQWGGDLNDNMTRVLATNLSDLLATDRVSFYPWSTKAPLDFQVTMDVSKFETEADGATVLSVFWSLVNPADGTVLEMHRSTYRDAGNAAASATAGGAASAGSYDAAVAAMSRNLGLLSHDIAAAIQARKAS